MPSLIRLNVSARVIGRRNPAFEPLALDLEGPFETVRELLGGIIRAEVKQFVKRKQEAVYFHLLTDEDIRAGRESGRLISGNQESDSRLPDPEAAIEAAVTAFRDGLFYMFVNDVQVEDVDAELHGTPVADVLFVRLTPLAGG